MSKKPTKPDIKSIILNRKKGPKQKQDNKEKSDSDVDEMQQYNLNPDSYEDASDAEDLEDYKVDGYHPVTLGESFCNGRYTIIQKLGWGHFSTVWLVNDKKRSEYFAMKIQKSKKSYGESAIDELELLRDMNKHADDKAWSDFVSEFNESLREGKWISQEKMTYKSKPKSKAKKDDEEEKSDPQFEDVAQSEAQQVTEFTVDIDQQAISSVAVREENYSVKLIDNFPHFGVHGKHYCSVFEIMGPTLLDLIQHFEHYDKVIAPWLVKIITKQALIGLVYMHDVCSIIHTDLKPENIMIQLKPSYLGEFIEDLKKYKKRPTSMKFLAIQQQKNNNSKNKKKYLKKKKKKQLNKPDEPNAEQANTPANENQPVQEHVVKDDPIPNENNLEVTAPTQNSETATQNEQEVPKSEQLGEKVEVSAPVDSKETKQKKDVKAKPTKNKEKPPKKEFVQDDDDDEDYSDVESSKDGSGSSSSKAPSVDEATLYTLKWKEHIMIKLDREFQIKIVDFGNACWTHKKFTDSIQTREYRAPEVIIGADYQANTDIWSLACIVFELLTNNYLFKPKKGQGFGKSDDHLALMIETLGKINKTFAMSGSRSREFFNKSGQLINIKVPYNNSKSKDLRVMPIHEILMEDHDFSEKEALAIESFLMPMLEFDPKKRISAREALKHPWLWSV